MMSEREDRRLLNISIAFIIGLPPHRRSDAIVERTVCRGEREGPVLRGGRLSDAAFPLAHPVLRGFGDGLLLLVLFLILAMDTGSLTLPFLLAAGLLAMISLYYLATRGTIAGDEEKPNI